MYEAIPQPTRKPTKSTDCPDCGAPLKSGYPMKYGWGTMTVYECGKTHDDGPGSPCPKKPTPVEAAPVAVVDVAAAPDVLPMAAADTPNELTETFPVVLVDGVLQEIKTIPELSKAARLEEVLAHVESFSKMVVTKDDKKGADLADERRKLAKRIRVAASKICKQEREDSVEELKKIQSFWISTDKTIEARMNAVEEHLAAQVKVYNDEKERITKEAQAEKDRIAAEAAAEAKRVLQSKIQRISDLGGAPNVVEIEAATDEQFEAMVTAAAEAQAKLIAQQEADRIERERLTELQRARTVLIEGRTGELLRAGVAAFWKTLDELADMDADEFAQKLADSIEAKALADQEVENARIEREEKAERIRTRSALALAVGWSIDAEWLGTATEAEFQAHLATATTAKEQRDRDAAELERLRKDATERAENERLAREAQEKADREAHEAAEAERIAAEEADRIERERPDKEKALRWLDGIDHELVIMQPVFAEQRIADLMSNGLTRVILSLHGLKRELEAA